MYLNLVPMTLMTQPMTAMMHGNVFKFGADDADDAPDDAHDAADDAADDAHDAR